jgi:hypothetical protein
MSDQIIAFKNCNKCGIEKPVSDYQKAGKNCIGKSAWRASCKLCDKNIDKKLTLFRCGGCKSTKPKNEFFRVIANNTSSFNNLCTHCHLMETDISYKKAQKSKIRWKSWKLQNEEQNKIKESIRNNIRDAIKRKGFKKNTKIYEILGCDYQTVKTHFEEQFTDGMTWENQGLWHIDHVIPIKLAKDENAVIALNNYKNLRPVWAAENLAKSGKVPSNDIIAAYGLEDLYKLVA